MKVIKPFVYKRTGWWWIRCLDHCGPSSYRGPHRTLKSAYAVAAYHAEFHQVKESTNG